MNYIKELNAFYDWLESNPCSSDAIALWHALVAVCNKAGWPKEFTVANSTLQAKAGLSRVKLDRWRGFLKSKGLIHYQKSEKVNEAGKYSLVPFVPIVQNDTQNDKRNDIRDDMHNITRNDLQNEHIIRTKQKQNENTSPTTGAGVEIEPSEYQTMADAHRKVFNQLILPSIHSDFLIPVMHEFGEPYVVELLLEAGESSSKPNIRYVKEIHNRWQKEGIRSRAEAKAKKGGGQAPSRSYPSRPGKPTVKIVEDDGKPPDITPEEWERMMEMARRLQEDERP